jgi:hypothetical protein
MAGDFLGTPLGGILDHDCHEGERLGRRFRPINLIIKIIIQIQKLAAETARHGFAMVSLPCQP